MLRSSEIKLRCTMWFKQLQAWQLTQSINSSPQALIDKLQPLAFTPCAATLPTSCGFVSPIDEPEMPLVRAINGCLLFCLQIEEKILPNSVINLAVKDKVQLIEQNEHRKVRSKEKLAVKDEVTYTLLPRAFSKFTKIYAFIDTRHGFLFVNNTNQSRVETFLSMFKKACGEIVDMFAIERPATTLTRWLKDKNSPKTFNIEKSCVLQDPQQQTRVIRCQQQDLFAGSIHSLVKDGCEAIQIALSWHDRINFILTEACTLKSIRRSEDGIAEFNDYDDDKQLKFDADFFMMTETFAPLWQDILLFFSKTSVAVNELETASA